MAQAVQELFPDAKLGIGPPIDDGFYYDFDVDDAVHPRGPREDRDADAQDRQGGPAVLPPRRCPTTRRSSELADEPYKLELIGLKGGPTRPTPPRVPSVEVGGGELTIYDNLRATATLAWKDLCRGPHLPTTKRIPAFKLMRSAAAYWRGDEKNKQLQRIYGTAWESKEALEEHLHRLEEAERRDHRKLGRELDLYSLPRRARLRPGGLPPQGRRDQAGDGGLRPAAAHRGGLPVRRHPAHLQGGAVPHLRPPAVLRRRRCSRRWRWRARTTTSRP